MSEQDNTPLAQALAFGKFVPGFDFLQNLAKGAAHNIPQLPNPANWIAPTLNVQELEKRIAELKAVQFWLDQNATALKATIQALEVQKMTLATLKGMNFNMGDVANALKLKAADTVMGGVSQVSERVGVSTKKTNRAKPKAANSALPDPMQWWGSLTQQFTDIASSAMKDAARQTALDTSKHLAQGFAKEAARAASRTAQQTAQTMRDNLSKFTTKTIAAPAYSTPASSLKGLKKTATKKRVARKTRSTK
jgi:hypothetical protein